MDYREAYERWLCAPRAQGFHAELVAMDEAAVREAFSAELNFGTAGLRGIMGPGTNRMNVFTVAQTARAVADEIAARGAAALERGAVVAYDCRNGSRLFAAVTAAVLARAGARVRLFDGMRPTPELSFAVREYGCEFGVNVTASHNPKEYNGYKVYGPTGAQIGDAEAAVISRRRAEIDLFDAAPGEEALSDEALRAAGVEILGAETDEAFLRRVAACAVTEDAAALAPEMKIVFTPFHGAGRVLVPEILRRRGFANVIPVAGQMVPDGNFSTVASPNPEDPAGFALALEVAGREDADLILGTDPDADRIGVMTRRPDRSWVSLTGNQLGVLLEDYILTAGRAAGKLPPRPAVLSTIVSTMMARAVAEANGAVYGETFTGFRFLAEKMDELEARGITPVLCFEESCGYLSGGHARDKDSVSAAMLVAEMAAWHRARGRDLAGALDELMARYGWYREKTLNVRMPGLDGLARMAALMRDLRADPPASIGGDAVTAVSDYLAGTRTPAGGPAEALALGRSDVLAFELAGGSRVMVRPSGTEPKVKLYVLVRAGSGKAAEEKLACLCAAAEALVR